MRKKEKEITDRDEVLSVLRRALIIRLAMAGRDGPYVLPVNFGHELPEHGDGWGVLYVHCSHKGRKMEMLRSDPRVCFEAETDVAVVPPRDPSNACDFGMRFRSVVGFGTAEILTGPEDVRHGLDVLMAHYSDQAYDYPDTVLRKTAILRIPIESLTGKKDGLD